MATYTKETALYDTGKIGTDIGAAGETASKYITAVDQNGIKVHSENSDNINYSLINADGMEVFKGTTVENSKSVAVFGENSRVGSEYDANIQIYNSEILGYGKGGSEIFGIYNTDALNYIPAVGIITEYYTEADNKGDYALQGNFIDSPSLSRFSSIYNQASASDYLSAYIDIKFKYDSGTKVGRFGTGTVSFRKGYSIPDSGERSGSNQFFSYYTKIGYGGSTTGHWLTIRITSSSTDYYITDIRVSFRNTSNRIKSPMLVFGGDNNEEHYDRPCSVSCGLGVLANSYGAAFGKYNDHNYGAEESPYVFMIGNGNKTTPSNAFTVDWDGNVNIAVNTTATSGDDFNLYTAISDLGWASDVIV